MDAVMQTDSNVKWDSVQVLLPDKNADFATGKTWKLVYFWNILSVMYN